MEMDHAACYRAIAAREARFDGRFFTCVKTTGIYCRPICPARTPLEKNVFFVPSAAAAQAAGFRACLRCRPETVPELGAWRGASNTVSRALGLIEMGALDDADVTTLAARVGVGERHLSRLFKKHLGVSPKAVAQTRRMLLAKQLILETKLPITEIALTAGFHSLRPFYENFTRIFGQPPTELRRQKSVTIAWTPKDAVTLLLPYRPPYDWAAMYEFLRVRAIPGIEHVEGETYRRTILAGGAAGVLVVYPAGGDALRVSVSVANITALPNVIARVRRLFDLAADPDAISAQLWKDSMLAGFLVERPGVRVPGAWDGFELAVRAVLGQQITVAGAVRLAGRLVARFGEAVPDPGHCLTHLFPTAAVLAAADLRDCGLPRRRAACLSALAAAVVEDPDIFGVSRDLAGAVARLRALPGIGEWTAQYIAMRAMRAPDAFPAGDVGLLRAMAAVTGVRPTPEALAARAEAWRPWRAYGAQYLWSVGLTDAAGPGV